MEEGATSLPEQTSEAPSPETPAVEQTTETTDVGTAQLTLTQAQDKLEALQAVWRRCQAIRATLLDKHTTLEQTAKEQDEDAEVDHLVAVTLRHTEHHSSASSTRSVEKGEEEESVSVSKLQKVLQKLQKDAESAAYRANEAQEDIEELQQQSQSMSDNIRIATKKYIDVREPQTIAAIKELNVDALAKSQQIVALQTDMGERLAQIKAASTENETLQKDVESKHEYLEKLTNQVTLNTRQNAGLTGAQTYYTAEKEKVLALWTTTTKEHQDALNRKKTLEQHRMDQIAALEHLKGDITDLDRHCDELDREFAFAKENTSAQRQDLVRLENDARASLTDYKNAHDSFQRAVQARDGAVKNARRLENLLNSVRNTLPLHEQVNQDLERNLAATKMDAKQYQESAVTTRRDIDVALFSYLQQENMEALEKQMLQASALANRALEADRIKYAMICQELQRQVEALTIEKDLKGRDQTRAEIKLREIHTELESARNLSFEVEKNHEAAVNRIRAAQLAYEQMKNERNAFGNEMSALSQRAAEIKEKIRIMGNETEILRSETSTKERELFRAKQDNQAIMTERDMVRSEVNKLSHTCKAQKEQLETIEVQIHNANCALSKVEADLAHLKKEHAFVVHDCAALRDILATKEKEIEGTKERLEYGETVISKGIKTLAEQQEEKQLLTMAMQDLERKVALLTKMYPQIGEFVTANSQLQKELDALKKEGASISDILETRKDHAMGRLRFLKGNDPAVDTLKEKLDSTCQRLIEKESLAVERDVYLKELTVKVDALALKKEEKLSDRTDCASQVNECLRKSRDCDKQMLAKASEWTMQRELVATLGKQVQDLTETLQSMQDRMSRGLAPSKAIENEYNASVQKKQKQAEEAAALRRASIGPNGETVIPATSSASQTFYINNGVRTAAAPRRASYLPTGGTIATKDVMNVQVARVFSTHAPFKPSELGVQAKKIKKPQIKPIEI